MRKSIHSPEQLVLQTLLRDARHAAGLRQEDLAQRLERPQTFVSRYEIGERILDLPELRQVCQALEVPFLEFVARYEQALREKGL